MSQNPYAQFGQQGGQFGHEDFEPMPSRTSIMAVMSLVLGIIAAIPGVCCIPGPGAIAVILGGVSALLIGRSMGRLTGMGLAITGIVLGLLTSVFSIFVLIGASSINREVGAQFFKPVAVTLQRLETGDHTTFRGALTPAANAKVTDEQIVDFVARYKAELGSFNSAPEDIIGVVRGFMKLAQAQNQANQKLGSPGQNFIPIPAEFSKGNAMVLVLFDPASMGKASSGTAPGGAPTLGPIAVNFCVLTLDGKEIWLWDLDESRKLMFHGKGMPPPPGLPGLPPPPVSPGKGGDASGPASTPDAPPDAPKDPAP